MTRELIVETTPMPLGDVNVQAVQLDAAGVLTLVTNTESPTGSGIYTVTKDAGASAPQVITDIVGGSGYAMITIKAAVAGAIAIEDDGVTFFLQSRQDWVAETTDDAISLRDRDGDGAVWVEFGRQSFAAPA